MDMFSDTAISYIGNFFERIFDYFLSVPTQLLSQAIQLILFTSAISSLIIYIFKLIRFEYAQVLTNNWIFRIIITFVFFSAKIWNRWSNSFAYANYFCCVVICLYLYDCICNIGEAYNTYSNQKKGKFKQLILILATFCLVGSILYCIYLGKYSGQLFVSFYYKQESNNLAYIVALSGLILIINILKTNRSMHGLLLTILLCIIVLLRHQFVVLSASSVLFQFPLQSLLYMAMAFDAQAKQSWFINKKYYGLNYYLLSSCTWFYLYVLMNQRLFPIQLVFGLVALGMSLMNK